MIVYRFEDPKGCGVYRYGPHNYGECQDEALCDGRVPSDIEPTGARAAYARRAAMAANARCYWGTDEEHPAPNQDTGIGERWWTFNNDHKALCGCDSIKALCRWFYGSKGVQQLLADGCEVVAYESTEVLQGRFQLVFKPGKRLGALPADLVQAIADREV